MNGLSYKGSVKDYDHFFVVVDLNTTVAASRGMSWALTFNNIDLQSVADENLKHGTNANQFTYWTFVGNPNFIYQAPIADYEQFSSHWFAGGGVSFGMMQVFEFPDFGMKTPYGFKVGANALLGFELCFKNTPLNLSFDFRPGWGCYMKPINMGEMNYTYQGEERVQNPAMAYMDFSFFDWSAGISLRYRL